jgi:two-component system, sensor histidine kinase ChiS
LFPRCSAASLEHNMKIKIMAVDDEPVVLELLKIILEIQGYRIMAVSNGRDALKLLEVENVDGLFVDAHMPKMDGFVLTRAVRTLRLKGQIPIVMLTVSGDGETMRKGFDVGISFFLSKPFTRDV